MSYRKNFDLSVYFVLDPSLCAGREMVDVAQAAIKGGVTMLQYRDKSGGGGFSDLTSNTLIKDTSPKGLIFHNSEKMEQIAQIGELARDAGIPLIINDHVDIAQEIGADGVHLGQGDMDAREARKILGEEAIIGVTAFTEDQIAAINPDIVDYIGMGPFYATQTKKGKPILGSSEVAEEHSKFEKLAAKSLIPVIGIGGIAPDNAGAVIEAGADGVAMMRSISEADNPEEAARQFVSAVELARLREAS